MQPLEELKKRKEELQKQLADPSVLNDPAKIKKLSIEFSRVEKDLREHARTAEINRHIKETEELLASENDEAMKLAAQEELAKLRKELNSFSEAENNDASKGIIMEIRAGAGGEEAALFAQSLFNMYWRFAEKQKWEVALLNESKSERGGYKEIIFEINGKDAYKILCRESGVHRVQRIPETEKTGRIHTSTASVAVLPQANEVEIEIKPQDVKVDFFRSSGPGGQNVNKVETAVRICHLPSGLITSSQESRSQQKNRERAMSMLRAKLLDAKLQTEAKKTAEERRQQIGTADRSEKIRTYNFPQDRVTDHRIKKSWHNIESILAGNLEPIIQSMPGRATS